MTLTSQTTSIVVQSLHPHYTYQCAVSAVTVSEGPYTETVAIETLEDGENIVLKPLTLLKHHKST